jgi:hypothetical protein
VSQHSVSARDRLALVKPPVSYTFGIAAGDEYRAPSVARVAITTLQEARKLCDPELHIPELRADAERVSADLDYLVDDARWNAKPL